LYEECININKTFKTIPRRRKRFVKLFAILYANIIPKTFGSKGGIKDGKKSDNKT
jgi:hypothetical protein